MAQDQYLSEKEIDEFLNDLDKNNNGYIEYDEVEHKLDEAHKEIAPDPKPHHLHHEDRDDAQRHEFLRSVISTDKNRIPREDFAGIVRGWKVPSMDPDKKAEEDHKSYMKSMSWGRRLRAYWSVEGPEVLFIILVISMQIAFGTWQLVKYLTETQYRHVSTPFGNLLAVTDSGPGVWMGSRRGKDFCWNSIPTLFFLVLSMSRYLSTFARKSYYLSRFINWDLSQNFHIKISIVALGFATLHAIGHLTGSFLYGSRPPQQPAVAAVLGPDAVPRPYRDYVASLPGWSGIVAFGLFWILAGLSMPFIRKRSYEIFQLGHLLIFPIIGLLCAHGTAGLLQYLMLGYWLAFPTLLVLVERVTRIACGFHRIPATLEILDADTVVINVSIPNHRYWPYKAGQYIFLQVPKLSLFQWHPFTISTCIGNEMQVHVKTDGDWTSKLRNIMKEEQVESIHVGIDGPFGAPAQRFYDFDQSIVLGSGIGVTPFSGILTDLQAREDRQREGKPPVQENTSDSTSNEKTSTSPDLSKYRRVDFHWIVKDKNYLLWFSNLLNGISKSASAHCNDTNPHLDVHISTHVTQKRKNLSTYIFRYLLECHQTTEHPASPLTGLLNPTHFGRPDLRKILDDHYESMLKLFKDAGEKGDRKRRKVGVFFCGAPPIGYELADRCHLLTLRGREDRSFIEYHFMIEVFG